ncbi:MAG: 2-oxo acid dehydrogenase subunit E2, partial [Myxococcales bacterium]|nr:2-oxo acid dehydrogenase subunit E2 [Myxococcales bacterium]
LPFIVKAVVHGLKRFPIVNAELDEAGGRIILRGRYSVGVATATDHGLMVPVLHDADRMSILDIAREIARLSEAARGGAASRDELTGSTFTITSLGTIGGVLATPILNFPEVGILGVHAIRKSAIVDDNDNITVGHLMNLSVSFDHRIVDGFEGASFLQEVRRYLEDPNLLLLAGI